ncbi:MAG TPA: DUF1697 domain-containing protein [Candidatus Nanopelagicaceae bacterium]|nr:DUF1697 domain-containing protein [Candidatus Nanopelagicaceae bacterium]
MAGSTRELGTPSGRGDRTAFVAMLRAVNVGGRNRVPMDQLRELAAALGHSRVSTYIQSGNLVFLGVRDDPTAVAAELEAALAARFQLAVSVLVRTRKQMSETVASWPQSDDLETSRHVTFLASEPDSRLAEALDPSRGLPDRFWIAGGDIYLSCALGYGQTKLNNAFFERSLRVAATTRNWATVRRLLAMANALGPASGRPPESDGTT